MTEPGRIPPDDSPTPVGPRSSADGDNSPDPAAAADDAVIPPVQDPDDTVGTGSAIALGCIAVTLVLIVIGLGFLALIAFLN